MRAITLTCPNCAAPEKCVGHPKDDGHDGDWYCFACQSSGTYQINFGVTVGADPQS